MVQTSKTAADGVAAHSVAAHSEVPEQTTLAQPNLNQPNLNQPNLTEPISPDGAGSGDAAHSEPHSRGRKEHRRQAKSKRNRNRSGGNRLGTVLIYSVVRSIVFIQLTLTRMIARILRRLRRALLTFPNFAGWLDTATITLLFGCIAVVTGFVFDLIQLPLPTELTREALAPEAIVADAVPSNLLTFAGATFFVPVLAEELIFRALLLPRREERLALWRKWSWAGLALGAFVAGYLLSARYWFTVAQPMFSRPSFLVLITLLGLGSTLLYRRTGSIWTAVIFHWLALLGWKLLGGFYWLE